MTVKTTAIAYCSFVLLFTVLHCEERGKGKEDFTFKSNVDVVLVPVLVKDRQGALVGNLTQGDFQVFDNNKRQVISGFMVATNVQVGRQNLVHIVPPSPPAVSPRRFYVFLFDDLHLSFSDLARTRIAAQKVLASLDTSATVAVVSLSGMVNSGLTVDRAAIKNAMMKIHPQPLYQKTGMDCPDMDFYQAELIVNEHSSVALQAATEEVLNCNPSLTMKDAAERFAEAAAERVSALGEQDARVSLASLRELVTRTAALPGLSTLILLSPGFLTNNAQSKHEESEIIDTAALCNITINALDARGLYTTEVDASDRGASSTVTNHLKSEYRRAAMPLGEDVMAELAIGTGGTYVHNTNDLETGLKALTSPPEFLYLLEFHANQPKLNSYHRLKVKVNRDGLRVLARHGYFVARPTNTQGSH